MASLIALSKFGKVTALAAVVLVVPTLAYIGQSLGQNSSTKASTGSHAAIVSMVPEANAGLVLIPFFGAVLLFSSLHVLRARSAQKNSVR